MSFLASTTSHTRGVSVPPVELHRIQTADVVLRPAERQPADNGHGFVVRWKFAFEWCEKQPDPWWIEAPGSSPSSVGSSADASTNPFPNSGSPSTSDALSLYYSCSICRAHSPVVYAQGWMCLQPTCSAFWRLPNGDIAPDDALSYSDAFLHAAARCNHELSDGNPAHVHTRSGSLDVELNESAWRVRISGGAANDK